MSIATRDKSTVDGSHPVVSTRYDPQLIGWALARLNITKAELVKRALDDFMAKLMKEAA